MKYFLTLTLFVVFVFALMTVVVFSPNLAEADFTVAYTSSVEEKPAVAHNTQTGKFLVA